MNPAPDHYCPFRYLSVYYFHGQDLCMVPRHVEEDVAWMRDHAVDGVFVGVHDADLKGGNTQLVCDTIKAAGLDLWLIPSRLGGLMAGWHRGPSFLSVENPDWYARDARMNIRQCLGPQLSVFHPQTPMGLAQVTSEMIKRFQPVGIVWDELKSLNGEDHSPAAIEQLGRPAGPADMLAGTAACFGRTNALLKEQHPALKIACFIYAHSSQDHIDTCARIPGLDAFGCDGKCWEPGECDEGEGAGHKVLLNGVDARFRAAAHAAGLKHFTLLETQLLGATALDLTLDHLPAYLAEKQDHLTYYYYPYGMARPDQYMPRIGQLAAQWRRAPQG